MNKDTTKKIQKLFEGAKSPLSRTDLEFVEIITNLQDETVKANVLTKKGTDALYFVCIAGL